MTNDDGILTVSGLNVSYGESKVLFDISVNVRPGQVVALGRRWGACDRCLGVIPLREVGRMLA